MCLFRSILFKLITLILLNFGKSSILNIYQPSFNISEMALYIKHFNEEYFLKHTTEVTIIQSFGDLKSKYYLSELLSEISKPLNDLKVKFEKVNRKYQHEYAYYNILLIDSYESFR